MVQNWKLPFNYVTPSLYMHAVRHPVMAQLPSAALPSWQCRYGPPGRPSAAGCCLSPSCSCEGQPSRGWHQSKAAERTQAGFPSCCYIQSAGRKRVCLNNDRRASWCIFKRSFQNFPLMFLNMQPKYESRKTNRPDPARQSPQLVLA